MRNFVKGLDGPRTQIKDALSFLKCINDSELCLPEIHKQKQKVDYMVSLLRKYEPLMIKSRTVSAL